MKKLFALLLFGFLLCGCTKKLDINDQEVQDLYMMVHPSKDASVLKYLYNDTESFSNEYVLAVAIKSYLNNQSNEVVKISAEEVEKQIKQIFGDISFSHATTYLCSSNYCGFTYNENLKQYEIISGCDGDFYSSFYYQMTDAKKKDSKIILTEKVIYVYNNWDEENNQITIYSNIDKKRKLKEFQTTEPFQIDMQDYLEQASTYEYYFENVNGSYLFKEIKRVS